MAESFLGGSVTLHCGDSREVLSEVADNSIDAGLMDPPYALESMVKRFGKADAKPPKEGTDGRYKRAAKGFMGKKWDTGEAAFDPDFWREVLRVLKPGAYLIAFGGTRTYHRLAVAIEDAGFEVRDMFARLYGSGMPKSHDAAKAIDQALGVKGKFGAPKSAAHAGWIERGAMRGGEGHEGWQSPWMQDAEAVDRNARQYIPASEEAAEWSGWGTALKPALEPICLARKPLSERTIAANILRWGTGVLNIDACRIDVPDRAAYEANASGDRGHDDNRPIGRWPANVQHDGSDEVVAAFPSEAGGGFGTRGAARNIGFSHGGNLEPIGYGDDGSAARFFYTAKADADDRLGTEHPTVKPVDLIEYYARLITPPKGIILDAFAGTGTLGEAAYRQGFRSVLIEREEEYQADIRARMGLVLGSSVARKQAKTRKKNALPKVGGMFGDE